MNWPKKEKKTMPKYKDGTFPQVGDTVKGIPRGYNRRTVVGTIIQITEDAEACNCIVAFVEPELLDIPFLYANSTRITEPHLYRERGGRIPPMHSANPDQELVILKAYARYGDLKEFVKV